MRALPSASWPRDGRRARRGRRLSTGQEDYGYRVVERVVGASNIELADSGAPAPCDKPAGEQVEHNGGVDDKDAYAQRRAAFHDLVEFLWEIESTQEKGKPFRPHSPVP